MPSTFKALGVRVVQYRIPSFRPARLRLLLIEYGSTVQVQWTPLQRARVQPWHFPCRQWLP